MVDRIPPQAPLHPKQRVVQEIPPLAAAMKTTTAAVQSAIERLESSLPSRSLQGRVSHQIPADDRLASLSSSYRDPKTAD